MKQPIAWFLVCSISFATAVGCGGDDSSTGTTGGSGGTSTGTGGAGGGSAGKGGTAGSGGTAGTGGGGTAGTAGTGGGTADSGTDGGVTMKCGTKTCTEIDIGFGTPLPPCCPPGETNACGVSLMGAICLTTTPGTSDPRCPEVTIPMAPAPAPGCCTVLGTCGADLGDPLGCNDLSGILGGTPIACGPDAGPPPPPPDAGSDVTPPPPDTGTDTGGTDTSGGDTGGSDTGRGDSGGSDTPSSDGTATDASGDRAG
jgi:hypothetical protein